MSKLQELLNFQNTRFSLRETEVYDLKNKTAEKIIKADSKEAALLILTNFRKNYDVIRLT